jgi:hypothetical protein
MKSRAVRPALARQPRAVTAASVDGVIAFKLVPFVGGIHVERTQLHAGSGRLVQSMRFADEASFVRWCEADRLRLAYPLLYVNLQRSGCALFHGP